MVGAARADRPGDAEMATPFTSSKEFREVMDRVFSMMSEDPEMGRHAMPTLGAKPILSGRTSEFG